jgi:hypothetical protein
MALLSGDLRDSPSMKLLRVNLKDTRVTLLGGNFKDFPYEAA